MLFTLSGIVMLVSFVQSEKAALNMSVTPLGIKTVSSVSLHITTTIVGVTIFEPSAMINSLILQFKKALSPITVTLSGIVILVKLVQPENAKESILVTPSGISTFSMVLLHSSTIAEVTVFEPLAMISSLTSQYSKASHPMFVTLSGIVILVSSVQPEKA